MNMVKNTAIVMSNEASRLCTRCDLLRSLYFFPFSSRQTTVSYLSSDFPCGDEHRGQMVEFLQVILRKTFQQQDGLPHSDQYFCQR